MNVLVLAKTHVGGAYCVGGLNASNQSLRLYEANWSFPPANTAYQVGQIWEMTVTPSPTPRPPHVEDVAVTSARYVGQQPNLAQHLLQRIVPWTGGIQGLFGGHLGFTGRRRGYVEAPNVPARSTWFWTPDRDLQHANIDGKGYYRYAGYEMSYVGVDPPVQMLPAGTLVRVSLARWWKPPDAGPGFPERCYLQLSGWYV